MLDLFFAKLERAVAGVQYLVPRYAFDDRFAEDMPGRQPRTCAALLETSCNSLLSFITSPSAMTIHLKRSDQPSAIHS